METQLRETIPNTHTGEKSQELVKASQVWDSAWILHLLAYDSSSRPLTWSMAPVRLGLFPDNIPASSKSSQATG